MLRRSTVMAMGCLIPAQLLGQNPTPGVSSPATGFLERYREVLNIAPVATQVAEVNHLVLSREAGQLILERGKLYLLSPVGGRTVGAVFRGLGRFTFAPTIPAERSELQRFAHSPTLDDTISEAILIFADSTAAQFRWLSMGSAEIPGDIADHVNELIGVSQGSPLLPGEPKGLTFNNLGSVLADVKMERW